MDKEWNLDIGNSSVDKPHRKEVLESVSGQKIIWDAQLKEFALEGEINKKHGPKEDYNQPGGPKEDYNQPGGPKEDYNQPGGPKEDYNQPGGPKEDYNQPGGPKEDYNQPGGPKEDYNQPGGPKEDYNQPGGPKEDYNQPGGPKEDYNQPGGPKEDYNQPGGPKEDYNQPGGPKEDYNQPGGPKEDYYQPEGWSKIETRRVTQEAENLKKGVGPGTGEYIYGKNGEIITKHLTALETAQQDIIRGGTTPASIQYPQESGVRIGYNHVDGSDLLSLQGQLTQQTNTKFVDFDSFFQGGVIHFETPDGSATNGFIRTGGEANTPDFKISDQFSARAHIGGDMLAMMTNGGKDIHLDSSGKVGGIITFSEGKWKFSIDGGKTFDLAPTKTQGAKLGINQQGELVVDRSSTIYNHEYKSNPYVTGDVEYRGDSLRSKISVGREEYFDSGITRAGMMTGGDKYQFGINTERTDSDHPSVMPTSQTGAVLNAQISKNTSIGVEIGEKKRGDDSDGYAGISVNTKW